MRAQKGIRRANDMSVTDLAKDGRKPLKIGPIPIGGRAILAPMSGVTDAPFRRLAAALGAGLVVSEMTASDDLVQGRPISRLRCEAAGIGPIFNGLRPSLARSLTGMSLNRRILLWANTHHHHHVSHKCWAKTTHAYTLAILQDLASAVQQYAYLHSQRFTGVPRAC